MSLRSWMHKGKKIRGTARAINSSKDWYKNNDVYKQLWIMTNDKRGLKSLKKLSQSQDRCIQEYALLILVFHAVLGNKRTLSILRKFLAKQGSNFKQAAEIVKNVFNWFESDSTFTVLFYLIEHVSSREEYVDRLRTYNLHETIDHKLIQLKEHWDLQRKQAAIRAEQEALRVKHEAVERFHSTFGLGTESQPRNMIKFKIVTQNVIHEVLNGLGVLMGPKENYSHHHLTNGYTSSYVEGWSNPLFVGDTQCGMLRVGIDTDGGNRYWDVSLSLPESVCHVMKEKLKKVAIQIKVC